MVDQDQTLITEAITADLNAAARESFKTFCPTVIRDEENENPITLSEIHLLAIDFVLYCKSIGKFASIQLPYEHGKSALFSVAFPLYCLGRNQNLTIKLVSASEEIVKIRTRQIQDYIDGKHFGAYNQVFPEVKPDRKTGWAKHQIHIEREVSAFPSLWAHSVLSTGEGGRCGLLILDDVCSRANSIQKNMSLDIIQAVEGTWLKRKHPSGFCILANTPWCQTDMQAHIIKSRLKTWAVLKVAVNKKLDGYDIRVYGD